jgi:hypothetical protein
MWMLTTAGFYSAVQDPKDPDYLKIRSRDRDSLQALVDGVAFINGGETVEIEEGGGTDYPYRVRVSKDAYADWVAFEVRNFITYGNFKNELKASRGRLWAEAATSIWVTMLEKTTDAGGEALSPMTNPHYFGDWRDR